MMRRRARTGNQPRPSVEDIRPAGHALVMQDVWRTFGGTEGVVALRSVTLDIEFGELIGVVGRSGSGKSTLLNLLGLLDRPTQGSYSVNGLAVERLGERDVTALRSSFFGFVFQRAHLVPYRTARENVEIALIPRGVDPRERRQRASLILESVGLGHRKDALPGTLSGGEAQRVAIARAIAQAPRVLLCDEPTGNLDRTTGRQIMDLFLDLNEKGLTVLIATHDDEIAASLPRRIVVSDGVVASESLHRPAAMHAAPC